MSKDYVKEPKTDYKDKTNYEPYQNAFLKKAPYDTWYHDCFEGELIEDIGRLRELTSVKGVKVAIDTETTGLTFGKDIIVGISFSFTKKDGYYVPLRHQYGNLPIKETIECFKNLMYNNTVLMFNAIFDGMMLEYEGIDMSIVDVFDVQSLVYVADSNVKGRNLKWASEWYLGRTAPTFKETLGTTHENFHFGYLLPYESVLYTVSDSSNTYGLYEVLYEPLMKECAFTIKLDNMLVKAMLNYYIKQPIYIDNKKMEDLSEFLRQRILELESKIFLKLDTTVDLECVTYDSIVNTQEHGNVTMSHLKQMYLDQVEFKVKTPLGYKSISDFIDVGDKYLVQIELEDGRILECSEDHYFLIKDLESSSYDFKKVFEIDIDKEELITDNDVLCEYVLKDALIELAIDNLNFELSKV